MPTEPAPVAAPTEFTGSPGVPIWGGWVADEWEGALRGQLRWRAYRQMVDSHPLIAVGLRIVETLASRAPWRVEPAGDDAASARAADVLDRSMAGLLCPLPGRGWTTLIRQMARALRDGFSLHEVTYRREGRDWLWAAMDKRRSATITRWFFERPDGSGRWLGVEQQPPTGGAIMIPAERLVYFVGIDNDGNPEGQSVLRSIYGSFRDQAGLRKVHLIGHERQAAGMPVARVPASVYNDATKLAAWKEIVRSIRVDEQGGLVIPSATDSAGAPTGFDLSLMATPGARADALPSLQWYELRIAIALMVQFMLLGSGKTGSYALASSHTELLANSIGALLDDMADCLNVEAARLQDLNGIPVASRAKLSHGDIETADLGILGTYLDALTKAGVPVTDRATVDYLREAAGLPKVDPTEQEGAPPPPEGA